jgi:hypothetical protein
VGHEKDAKMNINVWVFRIVFHLLVYGVGIILLFSFPLKEALLLILFAIFFGALVIWIGITEGQASYWKLLLWPVCFWFDEDGPFMKWVRR